MHQGILKVIGRKDKSALLPTGVAVSVEGVEVRKEDGHLEGLGLLRECVASAGGSSSSYLGCSTSRSRIRLLGVESL